MTLSFGDLEGDDDGRFPEPLEVQVSVHSVEEDFLSRLSVVTRAHLACDRCGEPFVREIQGEVNTIYTADAVKAGEDEAGDIRWFSPEDDGIDVSGDIRDALLLAAPEKCLCRDDCRGLCARCGVNLNESACSCPREETDSRWDALKDIHFD